MTEPFTHAATSNKRGKRHATVPQGPISVRWNLADLPSAQHKAGLAGLALSVQFLRRNAAAVGVCEIEALDPAGLTLRVDRDGMQSLFDEIYAASKEEQERDAPFKDKSKEIVSPKRTIDKVITDKKGNQKSKTYYVYDATVPRGALVAEWDAAPAGQTQLWLKLWRDVVWSTLRGVPATREPFQVRANRELGTDGHEAWDELAIRPSAGVDLPSTYFLGAQARTAENAHFRDVVKWQLLLHFWPFVVPIYVPETVDRDGKRDFVGFALAVPEIVDLEGFVQDWPLVMRERSADASGFRPRDAVIDVAGAAGLDVSWRALEIVRRREGGGATRHWLAAVEVFHIEKEGNNVRIRAAERIDLRRDRADAYARSRAAYWSATFRRQRISNVLEDMPWWHAFARLCAKVPQSLTVNDNKFRHDCRIAFTEVEMKEASGSDEKTIEQLVYQAVRTYVLGRLASKYQLKWAEINADAGRKHDYEEKKEKIAREAFLAARSRTGADFVAYFTSTLCSVPQHLGERGYLELARALTQESEIERVRSLTLLALSANG